MLQMCPKPQPGWFPQNHCITQSLNCGAGSGWDETRFHWKSFSVAFGLQCRRLMATFRWICRSAIFESALYPTHPHSSFLGPLNPLLSLCPSGFCFCWSWRCTGNRRTNMIYQGINTKKCRSLCWTARSMERSIFFFLKSHMIISQSPVTETTPIFF